MSRYTLGIDTSNYATSLAVFDTAGEVVCAKKRFLPVKAGQLGLLPALAVHGFQFHAAVQHTAHSKSRPAGRNFRCLRGGFLHL